MKSANIKIQSGQRWNPKEQQIIDEFVTRVRDTFKERAKRIILYGSRARGDADEESDYDFLVLFEPFHSSDKKKLREIGFQISYKHAVVITAFAAELSNFTEDRYFYYYENVSKEGIEL